MALALNYDRFRQRYLLNEQVRHIFWLLAGVVLALGAGGGTFVALRNGASSAVVAICGGLTLLFIVGAAMALSEYLAVKAERPADRNSVSVLICLVDQLGNRQEFLDEIGNLLRAQGELYQYQAQALILATKRQGLSKEQMRQIQAMRH